MKKHTNDGNIIAADAAKPKAAGSTQTRSNARLRVRCGPVFSVTSVAKLTVLPSWRRFFVLVSFWREIWRFSIHETAKTFIANSSSFLGEFQDKF